MLFHMTATHTEDNCPGYNPELMPAMVEAIEKSDAVAGDLGIKVHFLVNGSPGARHLRPRGDRRQLAG